MADDYDSDSDEHQYSDSDQDESQGSQESSSDDDEPTNGLFDLEASEDDSDLDPEAQDGFSYVDGGDIEPFPQFMQLPAELREMVWQAFCPDLAAGPRVFDIAMLNPDRSRLIPGRPRLVPGPCLEEQTAPMRALRAIHKETRALAVKSAPHVFDFSTGEIIYYHEENDVIFFNILPECADHEILLGVQELGGTPRNIAIESGFADLPMADLCYLMPSVKRLYMLFNVVEMVGIHSKAYAWVVSDKCHHYLTETEEEGEAGLVSNIRSMFCWPDLVKHRDFAEQHIDEASDDGSPFGNSIRVSRQWLADPLRYAEELARDVEEGEADAETVGLLREVDIWPMVKFENDSGLEHYDALRAWDRPWEEWDSGSSDAGDESPDEYDSEGIDDGSVNDHLSTDDEDDLPGQSAADDSEAEDEDEFGQLLNGSSMTNGELAAQFSSDDDDEGEAQESHADASGSEGEGNSRGRASRPKRRVVDSDSEEESATETEEPPRPISNRAARALLADSEDEGDEEQDPDPKPARGRGRRVRAPPSDSEDEGEDEGDAPQPSRAQNRRARAPPADSEDDDESDSEDDEEEESSSEEEDEPVPAKRMSLAKRLQMEAQGARRGRPGGDDSDAVGDDFGRASDDDDEEDVDGAASDPDGLVMGTAEDDYGEGEESGDEY